MSFVDQKVHVKLASALLLSSFFAFFARPARAVTSTYSYEGEISEFNYKFPIPGVNPPDGFTMGSDFKLTYTLLDGAPAPDVQENCNLQFGFGVSCNSILTFSLMIGSANIFNEVTNSSFHGLGTLDGKFNLSLEGLIDAPDIENETGVLDYKAVSELTLDFSSGDLASGIDMSATKEVCILDPGNPECDADPVGESWFSAQAGITKAETIPEPTSILSLLAVGGVGAMLSRKRAA